MKINFLDSSASMFEGATLEEGLHYRRDLPAGTGRWASSYGGSADEITALLFTCPCGCGLLHCAQVVRGKAVPEKWGWDGDLVNPTLEPSLDVQVGCKWHGFLTKGEFVRC